MLDKVLELLEKNFFIIVFILSPLMIWEIFRPVIR
jgi:hypothetical protein